MLSSVKMQGSLPGSTPGGAERRVCRAGTPATPCCLAKYSVQREEPSFWNPRCAGSPAGTQPARWTLLPQPRMPRGAGTLTVSESRWDAALSQHTEDDMDTPDRKSVV